jgi:hypothetical protein
MKAPLIKPPMTPTRSQGRVTLSIWASGIDQGHTQRAQRQNQRCPAQHGQKQQMRDFHQRESPDRLVQGLKRGVVRDAFGQLLRAGHRIAKRDDGKGAHSETSLEMASSVA